MKQSPTIYPANVIGQGQNRQQIATVLQSMGFETDDISKAFNLFERSYGDKKYDISILTELLFEMQQKEEKKEKVRIQNKIIEKVIEKKEMIPNESYHNKPIAKSMRNRAKNKVKNNNLLECLRAFKKYSSDENEIIEVLLQTLNNSKNETDVFNNLVNFNDLFNNIKQRKHEWNAFKKSYNSWILFEEYDSDKHSEIRNQLTNHKSNTRECEETKENNNPNKLQKALQFQCDSKNMDLLNKKDALLITANTYSILKTNKEKTELMIKKCNEKMSEFDLKIQELQKEKKQYFSALMRTKNKLLFQIQSIRDTEKSIKSLHEQTSKIQNEIQSINKTKKCVNKFENQLHNITKLLKYNFKKRLEPTWRKWSNSDVIIWIKHIENEKYSSSQALDLSQMKQSNLCGKDLPQMNDFILRSFKILHKNDRDIILKNIQRITLLKPVHNNIQNIKNNKNSNNNSSLSQANSKKKKKQLCVVCSDGEANHIMIPCGHICVCSNCVQQIKQQKKCAFCGNSITNVIKCFHVGF